jgi:hypothetical protein
MMILSILRHRTTEEFKDRSQNPKSNKRTIGEMMLKEILDYDHSKIKQYHLLGYK